MDSGEQPEFAAEAQPEQVPPGTAEATAAELQADPSRQVI